MWPHVRTQRRAGKGAAGNVEQASCWGPGQGCGLSFSSRAGAVRRAEQHPQEKLGIRCTVVRGTEFHRRSTKGELNHRPLSPPRCASEEVNLDGPCV